MNKMITCIGLSAFILVLTGCVTRTYTDEPQNRGARVKQGYGSSGDVKEKSKERVWFWQNDFQNPK